MLEWLNRILFSNSAAAIPKKNDGAGKERIDGWMREALAFHQKGEFKHASGLYQKTLQEQPNHPHALYLLGEIANRSGQSGQAIELISRAILSNGAVAIFHHALGCALQAGGNLDGAIASYRMAHKLNPADASICNDLGCALHAQGQPQEARQYFEQALSIDPHFAPAHFNLGEIAKESGKLDEAVEQYRLGLAIEPANARGHVSLSLALKQQGKLEQAEGHVREAVRITPDYLDAHRALANILWTQEKFDKISAAYRDIVRLKLAAARPAAQKSGAAEKVVLKNTTLCCIDCCYHEYAIRAIRRCMENCVFDRVLFLTDRKFDIAGVEVIEIEKIKSLPEYSKFIVKDLYNYITTDFVLVVQYDGYILNAKAWSEQFQRYDYVGAKWAFRDKYNVGNGGFSLRSRRLLAALQDAHISRFVPEDEMICVEYRDFLEQKYGINFAPADVADLFSFEDAPVPGTFGFHGLCHLVDLVDMSQNEIENYDIKPAPVALNWHRRLPVVSATGLQLQD